MKRSLASGLAGLALLTATAATALGAPSAWLDAPLASWNAPGSEPPTTGRLTPGQHAYCATRGARAPETPEEDDLNQRGWTLYGPARSTWGTRVVLGASGEDGMCRPLGFHLFAYVDGRYAGTLSPTPMDSRADGVAGQIAIEPAQLGGSDVRLRVRFRRYAPTDPLCCPSRPATVVDYYTDLQPEGPVLIPLEKWSE
ncbi:MAG: LppP/LprE family lipoprotein [Chloroflexi bacterium]|nr:LppP/LprE family lipoprotein [Chloroflexota bacterium]